MKKEAIIEAMRAFISQRSGIEYANYQCGDWKATREAFMGDYRPMLRAGRDARALLAVVGSRDAITVDHIKEATRAYSGRLQLVERDGTVGVDYCTGQYFPTEYRNAACAVLASALWDYYRSQMPQPDGKLERTHGPFTTEHDSYGGMTAGEWIRRQARREFGRGIASRWFN